MTVTETFDYVGIYEEFVVPAGVTTIDVDLCGAAGRPASQYPGLGYGGRVTATVTVTPGETLRVYVGGRGGVAAVWSGGFNGGGNGRSTSSPGGGGGGATDIRRSPYALADRLVVAAGGGGPGAGSISLAGFRFGGFGQNPTGETGGSSGNGAQGGAGGTQAAGGAGGTGSVGNGGSGSLGQGGNAWSDPADPGTLAVGSGGGGGGLYGGGGGGDSGGSSGAGGGGGSSGVPDGTATAITYENGVCSDNGQALITYTPVGGWLVGHHRIPIIV